METKEGWSILLPKKTTFDAYNLASGAYRLFPYPYNDSVHTLLMTGIPNGGYFETVKTDSGEELRHIMTFSDVVQSSACLTFDSGEMLATLLGSASPIVDVFGRPYHLNHFGVEKGDGICSTYLYGSSPFHPLSYATASKETRGVSKGRVKSQDKFDTSQGVYSLGKEVLSYAQDVLISDTAKDDGGVRKLVGGLMEDLFIRKPTVFVYDSTTSGVITRDSWEDNAKDFGNADFNDHHFHYGYILHAFSLLHPFLPTEMEKYYPFIDALSLDICNPRPDEYYPVARHFDFYSRQSWASGLTPQGNGKSQESSSEAVNAYVGCYGWFGIRGDSLGSSVAKLLVEMEVSFYLKSCVFAGKERTRWT